MAVTGKQARKRLSALIAEVNDDHVAVEIVAEKGTAFLVSADEYRSVKETVYLLQSPKNAQRLRESQAEVRNGVVERHELIESELPSPRTAGTTTSAGPTTEDPRAHQPTDPGSRPRTGQRHG